MEAFQSLTEQVNQFLSEQEALTGSHTPMTSQEVAMGFVRVANEAMCRPIRALTQVTNIFQICCTTINDITLYSIPFRAKDMIRLATSWRVSEVRVVSTRVPLLAAWV